MDSGSKVILEPGARLRLVESSITGCDQMWEGVSVHANAHLSAANSMIEDAQYAVCVKTGGGVRAHNMDFENNNFGIRTEPGGTKAILLGNRFSTTGSGLKPAYAGQSPAPLDKAFTGVYLEDVGSVNIDTDPFTGANNLFSNLKYGVVAKNTELNVRSAIFEDIVQVPKGNGYAAFVGGQTGKAIYTEKGVTWVNKENATPVSFSNCHTAVETFGTTAYVWDTEMIDVTNGIITTNGNYSNHLYNNIQATDRGIELRFSSPLGVPLPSNAAVAASGIYSNTITLSGNANGTAINTAGDKIIGIDPSGGTTGQPQFVGGNIAGNIVHLKAGTHGIQVNNARRFSVGNNTVTLANTQGASRGIALNGGDQNTLTCNNVSGSTGGHTGLFALHADRARLYCNRSAGTGTGLRVEGMLVGKAKADIAGNTLHNNNTGLLYGMDAISGVQTHRGNRWTGSGTVAVHQGIPDVANQSQYIVDAMEDSEFLPQQWSPLTWFLDIADQNDSYACPMPAGTCLIIGGIAEPVPEIQLDRVAAQGAFPGAHFGAANNWLAQRRLYERLLEEGNPYPGDTVIANFTTAAQTNGLADYAAIQVGIRAAMAVGQSDQEALQRYEVAILDGLDSLAKLDRRLHTLYISEQDSADLSEQRLELLDTIQVHAAAKSALTAHLDSLRAVAAGVLLTQNNNLPDLEESFAAHEKTVNGIRLRSVVRGVFALSAQDSTTLEGIAALCPLSDGEAVLWARSLLTLTVAEPRAYDDESNCAVLERSRNTSAATPTHLRVYPNPATDRLIVEYHASAGTAQTFSLFNALGQLAKSVVLPGGNSPVQVPLDQIPAGIYYYGISGAGTSMYSGKVIVKH